jgi:tRNA pseudouridine38-40 synthase
MRYLVTVAYDGTAYHGFQRQHNALGIQTVIEKAIKHMTQIETTIHSAGRTDKGVHALGQTFHFDTQLSIERATWKRALNDRLPLDIRVISVKKVKALFHARHDAKSKIYRYVIAKKPSTAFSKNYEVYIPQLDIRAMLDALQYFEGTHDFKGFCQHVKGKPTIKTIYKASMKETSKHYQFHISRK